MWVTITKVKGDRFEGTLNNVPAVWDRVHHGDKVKFTRTRIIDYEYRAEEPPRQPSSQPELRGAMEGIALRSSGEEKGPDTEFPQ